MAPFICGGPLCQESNTGAASGHFMAGVPHQCWSFRDYAYMCSPPFTDKFVPVM